MRRGLAAAWTIALLLLAGCQAAPDPEAASDGPAASEVAQPDAETGSVSGVVTDASLVPVAGATAALITTENKTTTDANGAFTFNQLPAGVHTLSVSRLGYEDKTVRFDVTAGAVTDVAVALVEIRVADPHLTMYPGSVYIVAGASDVHRATSLRGITCDPCELWVHVKPDAQDGLFEPIWEPSVNTPVTNQEFSFGVRANAQNGSIIATGETVGSWVLGPRQPHRFTEAESGVMAGTDLTMILVNVPTGQLGLNQRIDFWMTLAYDTMLSDAYTALPPE